MSTNQPNSVNDVVKICETGNTCNSLSNDMFIQGIFADISGLDRPVTVSFSGNPTQASNAKWFGKPWILGKTLLPDDKNNYVTFATYKPAQEGQYRRQKNNLPLSMR